MDDLRIECSFDCLATMSPDDKALWVKVASQSVPLKAKLIVELLATLVRDLNKQRPPRENALEFVRDVPVKDTVNIFNTILFMLSFAEKSQK